MFHVHVSSDQNPPHVTFHEILVFLHDIHHYIGIEHPLIHTFNVERPSSSSSSGYTCTASQISKYFIGADTKPKVSQFLKPQFAAANCLWSQFHFKLSSEIQLLRNRWCWFRCPICNNSSPFWWSTFLVSTALLGGGEICEYIRSTGVGGCVWENLFSLVKRQVVGERITKWFTSWEGVLGDS